MESTKDELLSWRQCLIKAADVALEARRKLHRLADVATESKNCTMVHQIRKEYDLARHAVEQIIDQIRILYKNNKSTLYAEYAKVLPDIKTAKCAAGLITYDDLVREEQGKEPAQSYGNSLSAGIPAFGTAGLSYNELLNRPEWRQRRMAILSRDRYRCQDCDFYAHPIGGAALQVHHKYYVLGRLPWNYPDEALVGLCRECHIKRHKSGTVLVYEEVCGKLFQRRMRPCIKCLGAGIFPQWLHVEGGICFRCRGTLFEVEIDAMDEDMLV